MSYNFGKTIKSLRQQRGLTQERLAEYLRSNLRLYGQAMIECLEYFTNPRILTDEQKAPLTAKQAEEAIAWIKQAMEQ